VGILIGVHWKDEKIKHEGIQIRPINEEVRVVMTFVLHLLCLR